MRDWMLVLVSLKVDVFGLLFCQSVVRFLITIQMQKEGKTGNNVLCLGIQSPMKLRS
jgi:hypothetical protein